MNIPGILIAYLREHDQAELLNFGTFYVDYIPSAFDVEKRTVTPPKKSLTFRSVCVNNVQFVQYISEREFVSIETARTWLEQYVTSLKEALLTGNPHQIGNLGVLKASGENDFIFTSEKNLNLLDEAFAFVSLHDVKTFDEEPKQESEPVSPSVEEKQVELIVEEELLQEEIKDEENSESVVEVAIEAEEEIEEKQPEVEEPLSQEEERIAEEEEKKIEKAESKELEARFKAENKRYTKKRRKGWVFLLLLLLVLAIGTIVLYRMDVISKVEDKISQMNTNLKEIEQEIEESILPQEELISEEEEEIQEEEEPVAVEEPVVVEEPKLQTKTPEKKPEVKPRIIIPKEIHVEGYSQKGFDIIGGSFSSKQNAENMAKKAFGQGFTSYLIVKTRKGKEIYFVSYGSFRTLSEANDYMQTVISKTGSDQYYVKSF